MIRTEAIPFEPPEELRFHRKLHPVESVRELWRARELLATLAERDLRVRYKQAYLGAAWALISPVTLMIVFTLVFRRVAKIDTNGVPYPLFAYLGLLPWGFFSSSVSSGGSSLVSNNSLLNKVYCPREVFPLYNIVVAGVDMAVASLVLLILFPITGFTPKLTSLWVPLLFMIQLAFGIGVALIVSSLLVYLRDLRQVVPFIMQLGLFATPVAYSMSFIPSKFRVLYAFVNPLGPVIDGYRRAVLYGQGPNWHLLIPAAFTAVATMVAGYAVFKRLETHFADVA
jgi:ABC-2 type transport system permease protein/lipopolysaccharide transport system permease protein